MDLDEDDDEYDYSINAQDNGLYTDLLVNYDSEFYKLGKRLAEKANK